MEVYVVGKQWMWKIQHETGHREINELHIPVGMNVKLTMTTEDVIHNFAVPDFRTKSDVVPGRYTYMWFNATKPGKYRIQCMEYCGLNHSGMGGYVYVMEQRDFDNWLSGNVSNQTPVEAGRDLFETKLGCASCHQQTDQGRGPKLAGVFGKDQKLTTGEMVNANEDYIRNSILNPQSQIVEGYQPIMPTFKGQVTEEQLNALVAYIKSLGGSTTGGSSSGTGAVTSNAGTGNTNSGARNLGGGSANTSTNTVAPITNRGNPQGQGSNPNAPAGNTGATTRPR
jgi:cytochrome c oxidase subunit 2